MQRRTGSDVQSFWGSAEEFVIDLVVKALQRTKRWTRDGPTLRLLNKHWKQRVNENILTIQPRMRSGLPAIDPSFLSQFTRMTQLVTTEFQWKVDVFKPLWNSISQLCSLKRLSLSENAMDNADLGCLIPLTCLTALEIDVTDLGSRNFLSKLDGLPLKMLSLTCDYAELHSIMTHVPTLQTLRLTLPMDRTLIDLSVLRRLSVLHLRWTGVSMYYASILRGLTSLVSLHLPDAPRRFDWGLLAAELPKLKHLSFAVHPGQSIEPETFLLLLSKLDALEIDYQGIRRGMPDTFIQLPVPLKTLHLEKFRIESETLSQLTSLTQLNLADCSISNIFWIGSLKQLKKLHFCSFSLQRIAGFLDNVLQHHAFPELKVLTVGPVPYDGIRFVMSCLSRLSKLEVLGVKLEGENNMHKLLSLEQFAVLKKLTELRELGIFGSMFLVGTTKMPMQNLISLISALDALWVETRGTQDLVLNVLNSMGLRSPTLKIFAGANLYRRFMNIHHPAVFDQVLRRD